MLASFQSSRFAGSHLDDRAGTVDRARSPTCLPRRCGLPGATNPSSKSQWLARGQTMKGTTTDFLFEIGCEEIPAGMLPGAAKELKAILEKYLTAYNLLEGAPIETFAAPRRLAAMCSAIRVKQADEIKDEMGPPKSVSFDAAGKPTRAAETFAQKAGISVDTLTLLSTAKGEYLTAKRVIQGKSATEVLEEFLPRAVKEIPWPKTMYWTGASGLHFIRPIRWVVALLAGKTWALTLDDAKADRFSRGHRFLGRAKIPLTGAKDYAERLKANYVLVRAEDRRKKIENELQHLAGSQGLRVHAHS